jgi:hypothetical protein
MQAGLDQARAVIKSKLLTARVIASDETTTRVDGVTQWQWVFVSDRAILHDIAPRRVKSVAEAVLNGHRPEDWVSERYAGQQDLARAHPAGQVLQRQIKAWRSKFFVFLADRDVPLTNNISEREIRPSVVFRKVTNGLRSDWGTQVHAGYRSVTRCAPSSRAASPSRER